MYPDGVNTVQPNTVYYFRETVNNFDDGKKPPVGPRLDYLIRVKSIAVIAGLANELDEK